MVIIYVNDPNEMRRIIDNASQNPMFSWNGRKIKFGQGNLGNLKVNVLLRTNLFVKLQERAIMNLFPKELHYFFSELLVWEKAHSSAWWGPYLNLSIAEFFIDASSVIWREGLSKIDFSKFSKMELTLSEKNVLEPHSRAFNIACVLHEYIEKRIYTERENVGIATYKGLKIATGYGLGKFCFDSKRGDREALISWEGNFSISGIPDFNKSPPKHVKEICTYLDGDAQEISVYDKEQSIWVTSYEARSGVNVKKSLRN